MDNLDHGEPQLWTTSIMEIINHGQFQVVPKIDSSRNFKLYRNENTQEKKKPNAFTL